MKCKKCWWVHITLSAQRTCPYAPALKRNRVERPAWRHGARAIMGFWRMQSNMWILEGSDDFSDFGWSWVVHQMSDWKILSDSSFRIHSWPTAARSRTRPGYRKKNRQNWIFQWNVGSTATVQIVNIYFEVNPTTIRDFILEQFRFLDIL